MNILYTEWVEVELPKLLKLAPRHPKINFTLRKDELRLEAHRNLAGSIQLNTGQHGDAMRPAYRTGISGTAGAGIVNVLHMGMACMALADAATECLVEVGSIEVWWKNCPCDSCSGKGYSGWSKGNSPPCTYCEGTGVRNPKMPEDIDDG